MIHSSLNRARQTLRDHYPFYGTLADKLTYKECDGVAISIDEKNIVYYSDDFIDSLTDEETVFVLAFIICLVVFDHKKRQGDRDLENWTMACNYAITLFLADQNIGVRPECSVYSDEYKDMTSEEIYDKLITYTSDVRSSLEEFE